jgi:hypothetical protein
MSEAIMECAALRDLPRPVLINASPAMANGTRRIRAKQSAEAVSDKTPPLGELTLDPPEREDASEPQE